MNMVSLEMQTFTTLEQEIKVQYIVTSSINFINFSDFLQNQKDKTAVITLQYSSFTITHYKEIISYSIGSFVGISSGILSLILTIRRLILLWITSSSSL